MRAQARLGGPGDDAAQRAQCGGGAEQADAQGLREGGREAVENHGGVVEDVGCEAPALALGFVGVAEARG